MTKLAGEYDGKIFYLCGWETKQLTYTHTKKNISFIGKRNLSVLLLCNVYDMRYA